MSEGYERAARSTRGSTRSTDRSDERAETVVELESVTRSFAAETAVANLSLRVHEGELLTLLGPSGCGKTTTLRLLAGLDRPDTGTVRVRGDVVADAERFVPPDERDVGLLFQNFALFPHLSVGENVAFGIQDRSSEAIDARVTELLELAGLAEYREHRPDDLSGGQQQRVALVRSLAPEPDVLLLDEPFSNLDVALRKEMRHEVRRILKATGVTAISVTHDQDEALSISDRVAVIEDGHLEQVAPPETLFQHPESRFVAEFVGESGFVTGHFDGETIDTPVGSLDIDRLHGLRPAYDEAALDVLVRPDDLVARPVGDSEANGRIVDRQYTGPSFRYRVELETGDTVYCGHNHAERFELDRPVRVELTADHSLAWFPTE
ncbi:ABC transporter ATP-binding protein [Halarchaeum salinum]|uniref:Molybdate/tungstate import ATP-binding protein WtpC n=1 Tax=Halarchaeum salinum TaxID=489912 RepID=A0AAV3S3X1_9EURY